MGDIFDDIFLNDDLDILDIIDLGFPRRMYVRSNYYENMDNLVFYQRFRLRKPTVLNILNEIEDQLIDSDLNACISPMNQLLTTLRFYATNGHYSSIADFMGMHLSTTCRIVHHVTNAIASLSRRYIKMPQGNVSTIQTQNAFYQIARFPKVLGCVDGTHIKIQSPGGDDGEVYRNRKGYFSLNTQVVGDAILKINDIVARWPGSAHDQTIFINSRLAARFEIGTFPNSILLADGGYALRPFLLTPLLNPIGRDELLYNQSQIRTRNSVERLLGVWKRRFPILAYGIRCNVNLAQNTIVATAVLHNIAIDANDGEPPAVENINDEEFNYLLLQGNIPDVPNNGIDMREHNYRRELIQQYFSNI